MGFLGKNTFGSWPSKDLSNPQNIILYIGFVLLTANLFMFHKNFHGDSLKQYYKSLKPIPPAQGFQIPKQAKDFENATSAEKIEFLFRNYLLQKYVLNWALNNSFAIFGLVGVVSLNAPTWSGYVFILTSIVLQIYMRPRMNEILFNIGENKLKLN